MERLTEKVFGFVQLKACGNDFCKETCTEHDEENSCENCHIQKAFEKLAEYEDLEDNGLLLRLPCRVGSTLYQPISNRINEYKAIGLCFDITRNEFMYEVAYQIGLEWYKTTCDFDCINKTVFLTKEEAEQKLKEMESEKLIEFLKKEFPKGIQMFNTRNWVGDKMCTIYNEDGFVVDYCHGYEYIEVFGLSDEEFSRLDVEING